MKIIKILPILSTLFLASCAKNEMKISRADKSIVTELIEQSPIYITKTNEGNFDINENNRIGNTDWVFSIESSLPISKLVPDVQRLINKKYADGMHPDSKKVYFLYMDSIKNQIAYLPINQLEFLSEKSERQKVLSFDKNITTEKFIQEMVNVTTNDSLQPKIQVYFY